MAAGIRYVATNPPTVDELTIVAVDLAARYSAACWMNYSGFVLDEWDSWNRTELQFIQQTIRPFTQDSEPPEVLIIEDLPHRLPFSALVKQVSRLQGRIVEAMDRYDMADKIVFVPPAEWRKFYPALAKRGSGPQAVVPVAEETGYAPPDVSSRGAKTIADKVATDYCAAFLIGNWAIESFKDKGSFDLIGTSRYHSSGPVKALKVKK